MAKSRTYNSSRDPGETGTALVVSMTPQPGEPKYLSRYLPLDPSGPLPPGLTVSVVNATFRHFGLKPMRVLAMLAIRSESGRAAQELRGRLDDNEFRRRLVLLCLKS
jgi:hypothetical protein